MAAIRVGIDDVVHDGDLSPLEGPGNGVGGFWLPSTGELLENRNPARFDEVLGVYPRGGAAEVNPAVAAAREAFPAWRRTSRIARGEMFLNLTERIRAEIEPLAAILARESGKVLNEARAEVVEGLHMVEYVFGTARQPTGSMVESEIAAKDLYVRRKPRGVVAVITPWNFPFAVPLWMLGPSLMEGNTVVFKPSEEIRPASASGWSNCSSRPVFRPARSTWCMASAKKAGEPLAARIPTSTWSASPAATRSVRTFDGWLPRAITRRARAKWVRRAR